MQTNETAIRSVVEQVLAQLGKRPAPGSAPQPKANGIPVVSASNGHGYRPGGGGNWGVFQTVDEAVAAATEAFAQLSKKGMAARTEVCRIVKAMCEQQADELGRAEFEETKVGRLDHKIEKLKIIKLVPGTEYMKSNVFSGDHGLTVEEYAPFGVIGAITPVTHSLPTLAGNIINMVAGGNTMVVNPHPNGARIACEGVRRFNKLFADAIGIENIVTIIEKPTLETADAIFQHRGVKMLCVTGGPAVARAAMASRKKAVVAGPGNPPVVVDETADIDNAAKSIISGAAFDNNLLCIGEKEVFAVQPIFDSLMESMGRQGAYRLNAQQIEALTKIAFSPPPKPGDHWVLNRDLVGKDPAVLAEKIGLRVPAGTQLLYGETDTNNPFVPEEQMMPFVPFVRAKNFQHAVDLAVEFEHGFRHTAIIHSRNVRNMSIMAHAMDTTLFIKNGASPAGLGLGGEGYLSFSIATPTGEGVTNPLTFTRVRRCCMVDDLRIV